MIILIIKTSIENNRDTGNPAARRVDFVIDNNDLIWYKWSRGNLPLTGDVQALLDMEAAELYAAASTNGRLATGEEIAQAQSRAWFTANSGAVMAIFGGTIEAQSTTVTNLVTAMFPSATAIQRTQMRYALMAGLLTCRCYANGEGLVNGE